MKKIKKAIIELSPDKGFFNPLSEEIPKELFLISDMPVLHFFIEEVVLAGVEEIVFLNYLEQEIKFNKIFKDLDLKEEELQKKGNPRAKRLKIYKEIYKDLKISEIKNLQSAILGGDDFVFMSSKKMIFSKKNTTKQILDIFKTSERPVIGVSPEDAENYDTEKIAKGLYKIKGLSDNADISSIGRAVFTNESKKFFVGSKNIKEALSNMIEKGHTVYGVVVYEKVFDLIDFNSYFKANIYHLLNSDFSGEVKEFIKKENLL